MNEYKKVAKIIREDDPSLGVTRPLFDRLIEKIENELTTQFGDAATLSSGVVCYTCYRTGREAYMSVGRYHAITSLLPGLIKKFIGVTSNTSALTERERADAAELEFLASNERCRVYNETFDPSTFNGFIAAVLGEVSVMLHNVFCDSVNSISLSNIAAFLRVGPGASSDVRDRLGTFWKLMQGTISFSSVLVYQVYRACTHVSPLTHVAETTRRAMYGRHDFLNSLAQFLSVPKTGEKNRGICKQPSGNMVLQLSTHEILVRLLKRWFDCNLENQQELNKNLAMLGSLESFNMTTRTWNWCTLDLSEASNFPSVIVRYLFPVAVVQWLVLIRSTYIRVGKRTYEKHMLSTMGNGFTFSLMTLLLSAIVKVLYSFADLPEYDTFANLHSLGKKGDRIKTWAVYGDDIIVDRRVYGPLIKVLSALGFMVNDKKSFSEGPFRESCGGDYYHGYDVRPVFCQSLTTQADIFSLINRLNNWSVKHSVNLSGSIEILMESLGKDRSTFIPNWEGVDAGLHAPFSLYNRVDVKKVPFPLRKEIDPHVDTLGTKSPSIYYTRYRPTTPSIILYKETARDVKWSCVATRRTFTYSLTSQQYFYVSNTLGILVCMLEGSVKSGRVGTRLMDEPTYIREFGLAPSWGDPTLLSGSSFTRTSTHAAISVYKYWEVLVFNNFKGRTFGPSIFDCSAHVDAFVKHSRVVAQYKSIIDSYLD
jgi:hypothetical protein